jgi:hypothetical protein
MHAGNELAGKPIGIIAIDPIADPDEAVESALGQWAREIAEDGDRSGPVHVAFGVVRGDSSLVERDSAHVAGGGADEGVVRKLGSTADDAVAIENRSPAIEGVGGGTDHSAHVVGGHDAPAVLGGVGLDATHQGPQAGLARHAARRLPRCAQTRHQQCQQQADDGDHHQQLDHGKAKRARKRAAGWTGV